MFFFFPAAIEIPPPLPSTPLISFFQKANSVIDLYDVDLKVTSFRDGPLPHVLDANTAKYTSRPPVSHTHTHARAASPDEAKRAAPS